MKLPTPQFIESVTPIFIASIGGIIGVTVLLTDSNNDAKWSSGMGLAGTAIAGAAGLAQSSKSESTVSDEDSKPISSEQKIL
ncbi:hypothetical protein ACL6C3_08895 [Capilliphycus salinus ALCB114379]|uniref:hypothetical protein n=1 Tax=Capilliphycus salinus TaxID=2768948 RepID=UPI0039A6267B